MSSVGRETHLDGMVSRNSLEVRVRSESLPVTSTLWRTSKRANRGTKQNVNSLCLGLLSHGTCTGVDEVLILILSA